MKGACFLSERLFWIMVNPSDFSNPWVSLYKRNIPMKTARSKRLKYYRSSKSGHPILACLFKNSLTDCGKTERKRKTQPSRTCCHHLGKRSRDYCLHGYATLPMTEKLLNQHHRKAQPSSEFPAIKSSLLIKWSSLSKQLQRKAAANNKSLLKSEMDSKFLAFLMNERFELFNYS